MFCNGDRQDNECNVGILRSLLFATMVVGKIAGIHTTQVCWASRLHTFLSNHHLKLSSYHLTLWLLTSFQLHKGDKTNSLIILISYYLICIWNILVPHLLTHILLINWETQLYGSDKINFYPRTAQQNIIDCIELFFMGFISSLLVSYVFLTLLSPYMQKFASAYFHCLLSRSLYTNVCCNI